MRGIFRVCSGLLGFGKCRQMGPTEFFGSHKFPVPLNAFIARIWWGICIVHVPLPSYGQVYHYMVIGIGT